MVVRQGKGSFRIWQFSDIHLYADAARELYGINCDESLQRVLFTALSTSKPADVCLLTGDLVQDESESGYQRLRAYIERLAIRTYCLPGNHDDADLMQRILCSENISCENHVVHQQWLVMLLDTTLNNSNAGHLSESECQRLDIVMRQYPDKHVLLAMHHPPLPMAMAWLDNGVTLDNPERVQQLVTRHPRIRGVIWGHAHREYFEMCNDVVWAGCPSTMAQFRPGVDVFELDNAMPGFRYLDLADDGSIASAVIRVPQLAAE